MGIKFMGETKRGKKKKVELSPEQAAEMLAKMLDSEPFRNSLVNALAGKMKEIFEKADKKIEEERGKMTLDDLFPQKETGKIPNPIAEAGGFIPFSVAKMKLGGKVIVIFELPPEIAGRMHRPPDFSRMTQEEKEIMVKFGRLIVKYSYE
jgi:hypothetical protein